MQKKRLLPPVYWSLGTLVWVFGCSSDPETGSEMLMMTGGTASEVGGSGSGPHAGTGATGTGSGGTGGESSSGGALSTGGTSSTGGESSTGGASSTGGESGGADSELIGWAADSACGANGTTGGGQGPATVTVSSGGQLKSALLADGPAVIEVLGKLSGVGEVSGAEDKTVIGASGAGITGGIHLRSSKDIIFRNIEFSDGSNDTFEMSGSQCIWFDHCDFRDGKDGNLDIVRGSDLITVSWSKFYYTKGHGHMLSNLCGNKNDNSEEIGKINITFHHNWWGAGVRSRQPRVRYGQVHVFNNYYHYTKVDGDGGHVGTVAAGQHSKLLVENNFFEGSKSPIYFQSDGGTAEVVHSGNEFDGTSGTGVSRGSSFTPSYSYTLQSAAEAKASVMAGAGVQ